MKVLFFCGAGKQEYPEKNLSEQRREGRWEASTLTNVPRSSLHVTVSYGYVSEETLALHVGEVTGQVIQKSSLEKLQPALFACFTSYLIHSNASVVYC